MSGFLDTLSVDNVLYDIKDKNAYRKPLSGIPKSDLTQTLQDAIDSFITKYANDLVNYYTKLETYTKAEVDELVVTHVVAKTPSDTTVTIEPNKLYVWSQPVSTLNVSFAAGQAGVVNEYMLQFATPQNTGTVLTLPHGVVWANDEELEPAPNYVYQVSIVNNLAIYAGWEAAPNE